MNIIVRFLLIIILLILIILISLQLFNCSKKEKVLFKYINKGSYIYYIPITNFYRGLINQKDAEYMCSKDSLCTGYYANINDQITPNETTYHLTGSKSNELVPSSSSYDMYVKTFYSKTPI